MVLEQNLIKIRFEFLPSFAKINYILKTFEVDALCCL
jgi:hypothetical protein